MSSLIDLATAQKLLCNKRILLLEDSGFLGPIFAEMLQDAGCEVIGPFRRVEDAADILHGNLDAAVMDVCIQGNRSFDLAESLLDRRVPVLMVSGYGADTVPERFRAHFIQKPFDETELLSALCETMFNTAPTTVKQPEALAVHS